MSESDNGLPLSLSVENILRAVSCDSASIGSSTQLLRMRAGYNAKKEGYSSMNFPILSWKYLKLAAYRLFPSDVPFRSISINSSLSLSVATSEFIFKSFGSYSPNSFALQMHFSISSRILIERLSFICSRRL